MRLFAILVRCLLVGAICIVASAVYIANAAAVTNDTATSQLYTLRCPVGYTSGMEVKINIARCISNSGANAQPVGAGEAGFTVSVNVVVPSDVSEFYAYRSAGTTPVAQYKTTGAYVNTIATISATYSDTDIAALCLVIANVLALLAAISFGWRMSIRPPVGLME